MGSRKSWLLIFIITIKICGRGFKRFGQSFHHIRGIGFNIIAFIPINSSAVFLKSFSQIVNRQTELETTVSDTVSDCHFDHL